MSVQSVVAVRRVYQGFRVANLLQGCYIAGLCLPLESCHVNFRLSPNTHTLSHKHKAIRSGPLVAYKEWSLRMLRFRVGLAGTTRRWLVCLGVTDETMHGRDVEWGRCHDVAPAW